MINQQRLKEALTYNPFTGEFTWRVRRRGTKGVGTVAGTDNGRGYVTIKMDGKTYKAHRLAFLWMTGEFPADGVDHISGVKDDNRWSNLRPADAALNGRNKTQQRNNTSGLTGICWYKALGKWGARISDDSGKRIFLGYYEDWFEAVCARKSAENTHDYHQNHGRTEAR